MHTGKAIVLTAPLTEMIDHAGGALPTSGIRLYGQNKSSELQGLNVDWKSFKTARRRPK